MRNYLPAAWLILIPVSAVATFAAWSPHFAKSGSISLLAILPGIAMSGLMNGGFAALYAFLNRVASRDLVFVLGAGHLGCSFLSLLIVAYLKFLTHQSFVAGERVDPSTTFLWSMSAAVFSAAATLAFFATMIVALQETRKRMNPQTFD